MPDFVHQPIVPVAPTSAGFVQQITLNESRLPVGRITWFMPANDDGVMQVLEMQIDPAHRRRGHASRLLGEAVAQARLLCKHRGIQLRRTWIAIEQKSQVVARAFLTKQGYHHTSSATNLLKNQDLLLYQKAWE
jgi:GNAT superfamily N-acetyltransferase